MGPPSMFLASELRVRVVPFTRWAEVEQTWGELAQASPYASFYLKPEWIQCWLELFGNQLEPDILVFDNKSGPVGICLLGSREQHRGPIVRYRVFLNAAGEDEADETCLEFNNLLCQAGFEEAVAEALVEHLRTRRWDEFVVRGFCEGAVLDALTAALGEAACERSTAPSRYVDLEALRRGAVSYEETISQPTRKHLRQNLRQYARGGEVRVEVATTSDRALEMLNELAGLHQQSWVARGKPGVFSSELFFRFHRNLIARTFADGSIQMIRVSAGASPIGLLYNHVHRAKVYFYQSGLAYADKKLSPGTVSLFKAIEYCLEQRGLKTFEFMAGDSQYKRVLSTAARQLVTAVSYRPGWKNRLWQVLRSKSTGSR